MCGRYTVTNPGAALVGLVRDPRAAALAPRFNVAPTQDAPVVRTRRGARELALLRWGLVPAFSRNPAAGARMINARAESVAEKPAFRDCLAARRCLVPADGFYEWRAGPGGRGRQPFFIHAPGRQPFAFAGLWASWGAPEARLETFTILTTEPTAFLATLHDRMPLILRPAEHALWLDADEDTARAFLAALPTREGLELEAYAVSPRVNRPVEDDADLLLPAAAAPPPERPQLELF